MAFDDVFSCLACEDGKLLGTELEEALAISSKTQIAETTAEYRASQEELVRKLASRLIIVSHYRQYGNTAVDELRIGGSFEYLVVQRIRAPKTFSLAGVEGFIRGFDENTGDLNAYVLDDALESLIALGAAIGPTNREYKWHRVDLDTPVSLTGGEYYWILLISSNYDSYFIATDDYSGTTEYCAFAAGEDEGTILTDSTLLLRTVSNAESDNEREIEELQGWRLVRSRKQPAYSFDADIVNIDNKYSVGEPLSSYLEAGKTVKAYIGFDINGLMTFYRVFIGETESSPCGSSMAVLRAKCLYNRLLTENTSSEVLGGIAYEDMIEAICERVGITSFDLRETGKTSKVGIVYKDILAGNIVESIRQATFDALQFKNSTTLISEARALATAGPSTESVYKLSQDNFIINSSVETDTSGMINRITVTNDENGETTTDESSLNVGNYQTIGTDSGTVPDAQDEITITLTEYACIYIDWSDADSECQITEVSRSCGTHNSYGNVVLRLRNKNYPDPADYDITVKGCPIDNAGSGTVLVEKVNQNSLNLYGKYSDRYDNKIFANATDAGAFADALLDEKSMPKEIIRSQCRGVVDIYPNDFIQVTDDRVGLRHLAIADTVELVYRGSPAQFAMVIEADKTPYKYLYGALITDDEYGLATEAGELIQL